MKANFRLISGCPVNCSSDDSTHCEYPEYFGMEYDFISGTASSISDTARCAEGEYIILLQLVLASRLAYASVLSRVDSNRTAYPNLDSAKRATM